MEFKHIIIIRFNYPKNEANLDIRKRYLEEICLHSLEQQTNKNFSVLICSNLDLTFDSDLDIVVVGDGNNHGKWQMDGTNRNKKLKELSENCEYVITTRLDSDDILLPNFVELIQKNFRKKDKLIIDPSGYVYESRINKFMVYTTSRPSQFISLVESTKDPMYCYAKPHGRMKTIGEVITLKDLIRIYVVHEMSIYSSTKPHSRYPGKIVEIPENCKYYIEKWNELLKEMKK